METLREVVEFLNGPYSKIAGSVIFWYLCYAEEGTDVLSFKEWAEMTLEEYGEEEVG